MPEQNNNRVEPSKDNPDKWRCAHCGESDSSPNIEAFELCGEPVCDDCADAVFEENSRFGVGA